MTFLKRICSIFCQKSTPVYETQEKKLPTKKYVLESVFPSKEVQDEVLASIKK